MREIGGYIELDKQTGSLFHDEAIALNCGRAAIEYLILTKNIQKLYLPYFCCDSIAQPCRRCNIKYEYYHVNEQFRPVFEKKLEKDEYLYIVNYYGQLDKDVLIGYRERFHNIIVDNAQAYFQKPIDGVDTLYTCRKFFGVSDGAFLYIRNTIEKGGDFFETLPVDESYERIHYVLGRFERTAGEFYKEFSNNNDNFEHEPLMRMSRLTENLLRAIDYDVVQERRTSNFEYLHKHLCNINCLELIVPNGAFMYPLYIENGIEIRKKLQEQKIYVPILWPDVYRICQNHEVEHRMAANILPLPIDQRYGKDDMQYITSKLQQCIDF